VPEISNAAICSPSPTHTGDDQEEHTDSIQEIAGCCVEKGDKSNKTYLAPLPHVNHRPVFYLTFVSFCVEFCLVFMTFLIYSF